MQRLAGPAVYSIKKKEGGTALGRLGRLLRPRSFYQRVPTLRAAVVDSERRNTHDTAKGLQSQLVNTSQHVDGVEVSKFARFSHCMALLSEWVLNCKPFY